MDIFQIIRRGRMDEFLNSIQSVEINTLNDEGENMLHEAIVYNPEFASILIDMNIKLNQQTKENATPLHYAAHHMQLEIARKIIKKGANVNLVDKHGNTPLWYAIHFARDNYDMVELLVNAGADTSIVNNVGKTVFTIAERRNNETLNRLLGLKSK